MAISSRDLRAFVFVRKGRSPPNLSNLVIDRVAKFLPYALQLLPGLRAILAFKCQDIDYTKQAKEKDKEKEKLAHGNLFRSQGHGSLTLQRLSRGWAFASPDPPPLRTA
jgi:hypothetical protein